MNVIVASVLAFEARGARHTGVKEQAIHDLFGVSAARYYASLNGIIDLPAALELDPVTVNRLHRLREARRQRRSA